MAPVIPFVSIDQLAHNAMVAVRMAADASLNHEKAMQFLNSFGSRAPQYVRDMVRTAYDVMQAALSEEDKAIVAYWNRIGI
jgi:hypothetical protein